MGKPVKVAWVSDSSDLRSDISKVETSFESAGSAAKTSGGRIDSALDSTAGHADNVASKGAQASGALSGLGDLIGGKFGSALLVGGVGLQAFADAGDLVNVVTESAIFRKIKDTAVTVGQTVATAAQTAASYAASAASKVWAAGQWLLNAALNANPIGLLVAGIALLIGAFVLAYTKSDTFRAIVDAAFAAIKNVVTTVLPIVVDFIKSAFNTIKNATESAWGFIRDKIINPIRSAKDTATAVVGDIRDKIGSVWDSIKTKTSNVFDGIGDAITKPFNAVVTTIQGVPGKIKDLANNFKDAGSGVMDKIIEGIKGAASFIGDIGNSIWQAVRGSLNHAIDVINNKLEFTVSVAGVDFGINPPDIPHLAQGGVTRGSTLALIGDNPGGREAVVPLQRGGPLVAAIREAMGDLGLGSASPLIGAVHQSPGETAEEFAQRTAQLLGSYLRNRP